WNLDLGSQSCFWDRNRHDAIYIVALPFEEAVLGNVGDDVKISGRAAEYSGVSLPGDADARSGIDPGRHLDADGFPFRDLALPVAHGAGWSNLARASASGAPRVNSEPASQLPGPAARRAGLRFAAGLAGPTAASAVFIALEIDRGGCSVHRVLKRDGETV